MVSRIQNIIRSTDAAVARGYLALFRERNALLPFLFHSLFTDERQIALNLIDPLDRTTTARLRQFIEYYLASGYRFVGPEDVLAGLRPDGRYAMATFDDGYFNNTLALPILEHYQIPALFFISTEHVRLGKCFWWDVLYRERAARGTSAREMYQEALAFKAMTTERCEESLKALFGADAFMPRGDVDRPFTPAELREFARHPCVRIGNHTANHAILTNYGAAESRDQIVRAQQWLAETTGVSPQAIAYPNGGYDDAVVRTCREVGLKLGFTVRPAKTSLPLDARGDGLLRIGRFTPHGDGGMAAQCRTYRSDLQLYSKFRAGYLRLRKHRVTQ